MEAFDAILWNKPVVEQLLALQCNPIAVMASFANGSTPNGMPIEPGQQLAAARELAKYVFPQKRSLDVQKDVKHQVTFEVVSFKDVEPEAALKLAEAVNVRTLSAPIKMAVGSGGARGEVIDMRDPDVEYLKDDTKALLNINASDNPAFMDIDPTEMKYVG